MQYRLCPKSETLDERCFAQTPLAFVGPPQFRWGGKNGRVENYTGTYVSGDMVLPKGSTWAMNPIPDYGSDPDHGPNPGANHPPRCKESPDCHRSSGMMTACRCSGEWGPYDLELVDHVQIPKGLTPGEWVLGWRW